MSRTSDIEAKERYYIATVSGKGNKRVIERYIKNQGRAEDVSQLRLFTPD